MHKDQIRFTGEVVPALTARASCRERDATLGVRMFLQGPDPLFIMDTCPEDFRTLCVLLSLSVEEGREAIEKAHWMGPASLLEGQGISIGQCCPTGPSQRKEALWLLLAGISECIESGYGPEISIQERMRVAMNAAASLRSLKEDLMRGVSPFSRAQCVLQELELSTEFSVDERGIPHTMVDHGFYILYKKGYKVVAVHASSMTFYGTTPETTLEAEGVKVDKMISPHFGIVFQ